MLIIFQVFLCEAVNIGNCKLQIGGKLSAISCQFLAKTNSPCPKKATGTALPSSHTLATHPYPFNCSSILLISQFLSLLFSSSLCFPFSLPPSCTMKRTSKVVVVSFNIRDQFLCHGIGFRFSQKPGTG